MAEQSNNPALNTIVSTINTLNRATYEQWCFKAKIELGKELYDIVTGVTKPPTEEDTARNLAQYELKNRQAMRILIPSIIEPEFQLIRNCETAREIWEVLESNFRDVSMLRQCNTFEQLISLKYQPEKTIHDHIAAFNKLYQEIKTFDHFKNLPDAIWVTRFLRSLPGEYAAFARSYDKELETTKLNDVYGHLRSEFNNRQSNYGNSMKESGTPAGNLASTNSSKKSKSKKKDKGKGVVQSNFQNNPSSSDDKQCTYCRRTGHIKDNCYHLKMKEFYELHNPPLINKKGGPSGNMNNAQSSKPAGHIAMYESSYSVNESSNATAFMVSEATDIWVADSGCSHHMVPLDPSCFITYSTEVPGYREIKGISGNSRIAGIGTMKLSSPGGDLILRDVLHAPGIPNSLLSLGRLLLDDTDIVFKKPYCIIQKNGFYLKTKFAQSFGANSTLFRFRASFSSNLAAPNDPTDDQISLWHARIAHVAVSKLPHIGKVAILPDSFHSATSGAYPAPGVCNPCLEGKQTRLPYPNTRHKATEPLAVIHTDTCNLPVPSIKGFKDIVSFTDEATRMSFLYYLIDKKPATIVSVFEDFKAKVELHWQSKGYKIKAVRMDGGSEYQSTLRNSNSFQTTLQNYLRVNGIDSEVTTRYSPESNGISERLNRTLLDMSRTMLFGANLPNKLWPEAMSAALYIKNRIPHSSIPSTTTPYELWYGVKPSLSHLRVFGCTAHAHIPEERRRRDANINVKMGFRTGHQYFVGYDDKAESIYKVWNPENDSILRVRNVIFDETLFYQGETLKEPLLTFNSDPPESLQAPNAPTAPTAVPDIAPSTSETTHSPTAVDILPSTNSSSIIQHSPPPVPPVPTKAPVISNYFLRSRGAPPNVEANLSAIAPSPIPNNYRDAVSSPDYDKWKDAMDREYNSQMQNNTWTLVPRPSDSNIVEGRWVYDVKDENPPRYKARFVAKGYSQKYGVDYEETYAPVVKPETLRLLFAVSAMRGYDIHLMDAVTAFLNSKLRDIIYIRQPEGYVDAKYPNHVCLLNKALYGLKQSALEWYETLRAVLESSELQFKRIDSDHAVFIARTQLSTIYLALFVDDIAIFGDDEPLISNIKAKLSSHFKMKDLGLMKRFLGLDITRNGYGDVILSQSHYLERVLHRFGMQDCKPVHCPLPSNIKLRKRDYDAKEPDPAADASLYCEIIGSLNHAAV